MRYLCLLVLISSTLHAQDGAAIYKQKCASCHEVPAARVPSLSTIKKMSGEAHLYDPRGCVSTSVCESILATVEAKALRIDRR
jgi:cytochrome c551/c552